MKNKDSLQRFLIEKANIRGEIVHLNQSYCEIIDKHQYPKPIKKLLGEALALASLMTAIIKYKGRLTLQFKGEGKLKLLVVQSTHNFELRGLVQFDKDFLEADLIKELQRGVLAIMIEPENSLQRYQGIVAWEGNSLAESVEAYFKNSEQIRTRIWLGINDTEVAGLLLQALPSKDVEETTEQDWEHFTIITQTVKPEELLSLDNETLLHRLYTNEKIRLFETSDIKFRCTCSVQKGENAILLLGEKEVEEELSQHQIIVVTCDFCNSEFTFDRIDVETIFRKKGLPPSSQVH